MYSQSITPLLRNTFFSFRLAQNEFNRPNEDAVTLCACNKMRNSMEGFLKVFLLEHAGYFLTENSFEDLLDQCKIVDQQFKTIDLSCFVCTHEEKPNEKYCFSVSKMKDCFLQTEKVKDIVLAKLNLSEKDFD